MTAGPDTVVVRAEEAAWQTFEGEGVVIDLERRMMRGFNKTASRIWDLIDGVRSVREIAVAIEGEFHGPPEADALERDVVTFVERLKELHLVRDAGP